MWFVMVFCMNVTEMVKFTPYLPSLPGAEIFNVCRKGAWASKNAMQSMCTFSHVDMLAQGWNRCVYFPLPLLECNKMQVHKGPPEEERLAACFLLLLKRLEKKTEFRKVPWPALGGTAGEGSLCVSQACIPRSPSRHPTNFMAAYPNPVSRRMPSGLSGPSRSQTGSIPGWVKHCGK